LASNAFSRMRNTVVGVAAALGAIKLSKDFLNTAVEVENLGIQLKFLTGSAEEGARAMQILTDYAAGVPFELQQISNAAPNLLTVVDSTDELNEMLKITGDIAAATGLDFKTTAEQMQRAFSGGIAAADIFREKGVKALLGFEEGVRYTAAETKELIVSSFRDGTMVMKGASAEMAETFTGTMSMLSDKLFKFQTNMMDAGPFHFIKALLQDLNDYIDARFGDVETAAEVMGQGLVNAFQAGAIGLAKLGDMIAPIVKIAGNAIKGLIEMVNALPNGIKTLGIIGFMMLGVSGKLVVLSIGAVFDKVRLMFADLMDYMATGKEKIAGLMDALGFDEYAKALRTNAADIKAENEKIRKAIEGTKDSVVEDMDEIIISMGKFGDITAEEFEQAGPLTQALTNYFADLNVEMAKSKELAEESDYANGIETAINNQGQSLLNVNQIWADHQKKIEQAKEENKKYVDSIHDITSAYGGAYMDSILKAEKSIDTATDTTDDAADSVYELADAFVLAGQQASAFGGAYIDSINKAKKSTDDMVNTNTSKFRAYTDGFISEIDRQGTVLEQLEKAGSKTFNGMVDALTNFVMTGKFNFKDFANMVVRELVRIAAQAAITFAIKKALGFFTGIPFLAEGGPAQAGKPYVVGEKGPELFIPNSSGQVVPNDELTRKGTAGTKEVTVNFTVNAIDAQTFADTLGEQRDLIVNIVNEAVTNDGKRAIA
jgi:hypothetical protein